MSKDDQQLTKKDFKIFLIDNNEGFVAPARNISIAELHSEVSFCNDLVKDAENSCKEIVSMTPPSSQLHSAFLLAHKHLRAAFNLGQSADCAVGTADITVPDIGPGISLSPGVKPKKFKSRHKTPIATVTSKTPVVSTGQSEPQDQGGVATAGAPEGDTQPQGVTEDNPDPDNLAAIADEELEGLEDVDDPDEESKFEKCK